MKKLIQVLRATIVGGVLFLVPFVVIILILGKAIQMLRVVAVPVAERIPIESAIGLETPGILAIILLVVICLLAGIFAQTRIAKRLVGWLETNLLSSLPGYSFMKNLGEEAAGAAPTEKYQSVLVKFDDSWQLGFLVERTQGGRVVVFMPGSPSPWTGSVFIIDEDRVKLIDKATTSSTKCLQSLGEGVGTLLKGKL
jgi:uncharacterized membrane protein